jgi:hypothetical protein
MSQTSKRTQDYQSIYALRASHKSWAIYKSSIRQSPSSGWHKTLVTSSPDLSNRLPRE